MKAEPLVITSLEQLKEWNSNPTEDLPVVWDWYADWIFDECLKKKSFKLYEEAIDVMVIFTIRCEKMQARDARNRVNDNLRYWCGRASKNREPFGKYFNKLLITYEGIPK
jgi:hypothetical protein